MMKTGSEQVKLFLNSPSDSRDDNDDSFKFDMIDESSHHTLTSAFDLENANSEDEAKIMRDTIIRSEERNVKKARWLVGTAILFCSVAVSSVVYFLAKRNEQNNFEIEYDGFVMDIKALVQWEVKYNFALMEQLSSSTTIAAQYLGNTFPFHTESQFEISGGFVDGMGGIMSAAYAPLVREDQLDEWLSYSEKNQGWIEESARLKAAHPVHRDALHGTIQDHEHDRKRKSRHLQNQDLIKDEMETGEEKSIQQKIATNVWRFEDSAKVPNFRVPNNTYAPLWQVSPADYGVINYNLLSDPLIARLYATMIKRKGGVISTNFEVGDLFDFLFDPEEKQFKKDPHGFILQPVYNEIAENATIVGFYVAITPFGNLLDRLLPEGRNGVIGVFKDDCGNVMTFELSDNKATFLGYEDLHETELDQYVRVEYNIEMYEDRNIDGLCTHNLYLYPSSKLRNLYNTNRPIVYTAVVAIAFFATICLFIIFDLMVAQRQAKTISTALKSQAMVTSLFPEEIGKQLIKQAHEKKGGQAMREKTLDFKKTENKEVNDDKNSSDAILAELYPNTTVMFADLVGFTAWSSMRDPRQVFKLLETIYSAFDEIAKLRRVFKVETIGDCYFAVCGLPQPRSKHHVVMARFAQDCLYAMPSICEKLGTELGPDTEELGIRIGINSGPVTAGVLRTDKARFQLFGDTVNTASRIETTGKKNKIHISKETAELLAKDGKGHWVQAREDRVHAKGKGELETFWLEVKNDTTLSASSGAFNAGDSSQSDSVAAATTLDYHTKFRDTKYNDVVDPKIQRHADWNADVLEKLLLKIMDARQKEESHVDDPDTMRAAENNIEKPGCIVLDEVQDIIALRSYDGSATSEMLEQEPNSSQGILKQVAVEQLHNYVKAIACLYNKNSFHCFGHASHVTMSVMKLLSRIVAPSKQESNDEVNDETLRDNSYGITSDPLTQFAVVISALIHDVDHYGVPNSQLIAEEANIASIYREKSIAEQNSIDIAWRLLMEDSYQELRRAIYCNEQELKRFRALVVNTVLATDICDKDLKALRNARWEKAFNGIEQDKELDRNRKATIVIEHLIQASDVAHTMQHWHVYRKWNERLFREMYQAYTAGRTQKDPSEFWYTGELGFFDFYIIPLARKLEECGVFGVSSDEYLNYALMNREEWAKKGEAVVAEMLNTVRSEMEAPNLNGVDKRPQAA